eukprot:scaffold1883_cov261-Pinguiococcus_pyrenoidosus.AAC.11
MANSTGSWRRSGAKVGTSPVTETEAMPHDEESLRQRLRTVVQPVRKPERNEPGFAIAGAHGGKLVQALQHGSVDLRRRGQLSQTVFRHGSGHGIQHQAEAEDVQRAKNPFKEALGGADLQHLSELEPRQPVDDVEVHALVVTLQPGGVKPELVLQALAERKERILHEIPAEVLQRLPKALPLERAQRRPDLRVLRLDRAIGALGAFPASGLPALRRSGTLGPPKRICHDAF